MLLNNDIPFDKDEANRYLPWLMAIMIAVTSFIIAVGIAINDVVLENSLNLSYKVQVQIPFADGEERSTADKIVSELEELLGVSRVEYVSSDDTAKLIGEWLSSNISADALPLPAIIDISLDKEAVEDNAVNVAIIRESLQSIAPDAIIESYSEWVDKFNQLAGLLQYIIYILAICLILSSIVMVVLITHTSMQLHSQVVRLLHRMGAYDKYITKQFQINALWLTFKGATVGTLCALFVYWIIISVIQQLNLPALDGVTISNTQLAAFILMPIMMMVVVYLAVHITVNRTLRRLY